MRKQTTPTPARIGSEDRLQLIAYEIHDGLSQQLAAGIGFLNAYAESRSPSHERHDKFFDQGMQALGAAMQDCRELVSGLRPPSGRHPHLVEAVSQLVHESHWSDSIEVSFRHDVPRDAISETEFNTAFRIIQESLNNVARHSRSTAARVEAIVAGDVLRVSVEDDGVGFDPAGVDGDHFGIEGMRLRTRLLGGQFEITSRPGGGTRVSAAIPVYGAERT